MTPRRIRPARGRWLVVHRVPGTDIWHVDSDCPTEATARDELARLQAEDMRRFHWPTHEEHLAWTS